MCICKLTPTAHTVFLGVFIHAHIYSGLAQNVFHHLKACPKRLKLINIFKLSTVCVRVYAFVLHWLCVCARVKSLQTVYCTFLFWISFCFYFTFSPIKTGFLMKLSNKSLHVLRWKGFSKAKQLAAHCHPPALLFV